MLSNYNVVFIVVDALRARNLSCYGYNKQTSPNIDFIAKKGVLFENAFSCNNITDSSITTIFSGKYPISHGVIRHGPKLQQEELRNINEIAFLQEILKSHGYTTLAVDWLKRWHKKGYDIYYDTFHGQRDPARAKYTYKYKMLKASAGVLRFFKMGRIVRKSKRMLKYGCKAGAVTNIATNLIKNAPNNFFMFIHYWDTHTFYDPPKSYVKKFYQNTEESNNQSIERMLSCIRNEAKRAAFEKRLKNVPNLSYIIAQYDGAIAFADHQIGKLVQTLEQNDELDETFIILTSDHGESLTEHDIFFDHHGLYDVSIHIPLIIKGPNLPEDRRVKGLVQHTDIVPTILDILNVSVSDEKAFDGKSLMPLINGEKKEIHSAIFAEEAYHERKRAIRTTRYKYIEALSKEGAVCGYCKRVHGGLEELYDLSKDAEETQNILEKESKTANILKNRLNEWIKSFKEIKVKEGFYKPSSEEEKEVVERLRKLGYF